MRSPQPRFRFGKFFWKRSRVKGKNVFVNSWVELYPKKIPTWPMQERYLRSRIPTASFLKTQCDGILLRIMSCR